jgi:agmatinase
MSKKQKILDFDPNSIGNSSNNIYGLPFSIEEAEVIVIPVPWEVTVSYKAGTAKGPQAIYNASLQVDLYDPYIKDLWKMGIAMEPVSKALQANSKALRKKAEKHVGIKEINQACKKMNTWVKERSLHYLNKNKLVALLGGDHSTPLGLMHALAEKHNSFAILQIDAHADLREAYEGFEFSHASIMFNALKIQQVSKLIQVGIRDYCETEARLEKNSKGRIKTFYDRDIKAQQYGGVTWANICKQIISELPQKIYLSFDIDGLDPKLCPNTGTPVPGGFESEQVLFLIQKIVENGKQIIAFDINEVAPGNGKEEWNANVAARLLYRIAGLVAKSNGRV